MRISTKGVALIKKHEGFRSEAYPDAGYGWARATIGYGHTTAAGPPVVSQGMVISQAEATRILKRDLATVERFVTVNVKVPLTQNQFDALVSFVFNVGGRAFIKSSLLRKLNAGDTFGAAAEFSRWRKSNGKVFQGLVRRRAEEKALFLNDIDQSPGSIPVDAEADHGKPLPKSTTAWSTILQTIFGSIGAFAAFDWKTALVIVIPITLLALYIIKERKRHAEEGMI